MQRRRIEKVVQKIRAGTKGRTIGVEKRRSQSSNSFGGEVKRGVNSDRPKSTFSFSFANAGKIVKVITGLKNTATLGSDGIPVSILNMGSDVLAGPISHLVNKSLATGIVPEGFNTALIHPVYKGGGKSRRKEPASYRPVVILCAMSKVLETVAKEDLEAFMKVQNTLPASQHGFRKGRSCTTAVARATCQSGLGLGQ
jgi:hypothetical protein